MEPSLLPVVSDEGEHSWSDSHSMSSDEGMTGTILLPSSPPSEAAAWMAVTSTTRLQTGQLSPISTGMDSSPHDASTAPAMIHSASSSCTDSWNNDCADGGESGDAEQDIHWEQDSDDVLSVPKLEPLDDDFVLNDLKDAPVAPASTLPVSPTAQPKQKRPRGRPRKHPLTPVINPSKVTKGRSKTGCITCRRRKKKCDEAKPRCLNCEKNAVVCEGYHEKKLWRSGKERAIDEPSILEDEANITALHIFNGVETLEDRIFWKHYVCTLSNVLTVEGEAKNAFKDIILPLAHLHRGLMHSILAISGKHFDYDAPYGIKILEKYTGTSRQAIRERANFHQQEALNIFHEDIRRSEERRLDNEDDVDAKTISSVRYAQILCMLVGTLVEGDTHGAHRIHLHGYQQMIHQSLPEEHGFLAFMTEFFRFHVYADELLWHPSMKSPRLSVSDTPGPPITIDPPRLIGVADGLLHHLSHITTIRNMIRDNLHAGIDPPVPYPLLYSAAEIEEALLQWAPVWPAGDSRQRVGLVYKQMIMVHLFRTIHPPPLTAQTRTSTFGAHHHIVRTPSSMSSTRRPSQAAQGLSTPSGTSSPNFGQPGSSPSVMSGSGGSQASSRNPSRTSSMHESDAAPPPATPVKQEVRNASPPPIRRPPYHDNRFTIAVEECLALMEGFAPSDPALTLLLMPCLVLGAASFSPEHQERFRGVIRTVRGYTGLRNCDRALQLLEEVWHLMAQGDWLAVWDWQGVALRLELDFACT